MSDSGEPIICRRKDCEDYRGRIRKLERKLKSAQNETKRVKDERNVHQSNYERVSRDLAGLKKARNDANINVERFDMKNKMRMVDKIAELASRVHVLGETGDKSVEHSDKEEEDKSNDQEECPICCEGFSDASAFAIYSCGHYVCLTTCYAAERERYIAGHRGADGSRLECHTCRKIVKVSEINDNPLSLAEFHTEVNRILEPYIEDVKKEASEARRHLQPLSFSDSEEKTASDRDSYLGTDVDEDEDSENECESDSQSEYSESEADPYAEVEKAEARLESVNISDESDHESDIQEIDAADYIIGQAGDGLDKLSEVEEQSDREKTPTPRTSKTASAKESAKKADKKAKQRPVIVLPKVQEGRRPTSRPKTPEPAEESESDAPITPAKRKPSAAMIITSGEEEEEIPKTPVPKRRRLSKRVHHTPSDPSDSSEEFSAVESPRKSSAKKHTRASPSKRDVNKYIIN